MATITHAGLEVCVDCANFSANGEAEPEHIAAMQAQWGDIPLTALVLDCDENEDTCGSFSKRPCDGCGSSLAGSRHAAVIIQ